MSARKDPSQLEELPQSPGSGGGGGCEQEGRAKTTTQRITKPLRGGWEKTMEL